MRRTHALPMYAALLIAPPLAAQQTGTVSGTVVAVESGAPLPGASVVIVGTVRSVLTNEKGQYHLSVPPGAHGVRARLIGYRSEEHTSELQSQSNLVCRLLLEKKKKKSMPCRNERRKDERTRA